MTRQKLLSTCRKLCPFWGNKHSWWQNYFSQTFSGTKERKEKMKRRNNTYKKVKNKHAYATKYTSFLISHNQMFSILNLANICSKVQNVTKYYDKIHKITAIRLQSKTLKKLFFDFWSFRKIYWEIFGTEVS